MEVVLHTYQLYAVILILELVLIQNAQLQIGACTIAPCAM
jgi:hypothetical protein